MFPLPPKNVFVSVVTIAVIAPLFLFLKYLRDNIEAVPFILFCLFLIACFLRIASLVDKRRAAHTKEVWRAGRRDPE